MGNAWWRRGFVWLLLVAGLAGCGGGLDESLQPVEGNEWATQEAEHRSSQAGATRWVRSIRGVGEDDPREVAHDSRGNVIVLGGYTTPISFGTETVERPEPRRLMVVSKYAPDGRLLWNRLFEPAPAPGWGGPGSSPNALAVDSRGFIFVTGWSVGLLTLGGRTLTPGPFLAKLDPEGNPVWARPLPTEGRELAVDHRGNIGVAGYLESTVDFGSGPITGHTNPFIVRYDAKGMFKWVYLEPERGMPYSLAVDSAGDYYLVGHRYLAVPPPAPPVPFIAKVSTSGRREWARTLEGTTGIANDVTTHGGCVMVSGAFVGTFTFRGRSYSSAGSIAARGFVLAFTRGGGERWASVLGSLEAFVAADSREGVLVTGRYVGGEDFGLGVGPLAGEPSWWNVYVARLDRDDGRLEWVRGFPSAGARPREISVTKQGAPAMLGIFDQPVDFGTTRLEPAGLGLDTFLIQLER